LLVSLAAEDLRDQHRLGDKHFRKEVVSRVLKVIDTSTPSRRGAPG
jgi:hypothetical protein